MKNYTDIEQSKVLSRILSPKSADMFYRENGKDVKLMWEHTAQKATTPCWSLAALINIIPQELFDGEYIINITEGVSHKWVISYEAFCGDSSYAVNTSGDNLIDCCVQIIIKLKERNLL